MDDDELRNHLIEISDRTARIDERTSGIQKEITQLQETDVEHEERLDEINSTVQKHGYVLGTVAFLTTSSITALLSAFAKVLPMKL